jgi:flagella basal body P-ring formation protein FlgA
MGASMAPVFWTWLIVILSVGFSLSSVHAQASQDRSALQSSVQQWLASRDVAGSEAAGAVLNPQNTQNPHNASSSGGAAAATAAGVAPQIEVELGELDPRLKLAPCQRIRAYLPTGANLWGRSRVGLRCEEGARWNIFWPVTVKVWAPAVVVSRSLPAGTVLEAGDLILARVDLAAGGSQAVLRPEEALGRTLARTLTQGAELRQADLKVRRWFQSGDPVKLVVRGAGFQAAATGTALAHGDEGRCARVRMESGRILCAQPVGERLAELTL